MASFCRLTCEEIIPDTKLSNFEKYHTFSVTDNAWDLSLLSRFDHEFITLCWGKEINLPSPPPIK
jgi:hypothetical protein